MSDFTVYGPYRIQVMQLNAGRVIDAAHFWESVRQLRALRNRKGVYVFGIKPPKATCHTPWYVGKASRTFEQEVFTARNQLKYNKSLARYKRGYADLFLIAHPCGKGKTNHTQIAQIESHFINLGFDANPLIENDRGIGVPQWSVGGVIRGKTKKASNSAKRLSAMFGLKKDR